MKVTSRQSQTTEPDKWIWMLAVEHASRPTMAAASPRISTRGHSDRHHWFGRPQSLCQELTHSVTGCHLDADWRAGASAWAGQCARTRTNRLPLRSTCSCENACQPNATAPIDCDNDCTYIEVTRDRFRVTDVTEPTPWWTRISSYVNSPKIRLFRWSRLRTRRREETTCGSSRRHALRRDG